ncbi:hypothetical protein KM043_018027 [Ampulex compressa]|nr:hypothetical protein KM043_018027 [Ampulex compressa]
METPRAEPPEPAGGSGVIPAGCLVLASFVGHSYNGRHSGCNYSCNSSIPRRDDYQEGGSFRYAANNKRNEIPLSREEYSDATLSGYSGPPSERLLVERDRVSDRNMSDGSPAAVGIDECRRKALPRLPSPSPCELTRRDARNLNATAETTATVALSRRRGSAISKGSRGKEKHVSVIFHNRERLPRESRVMRRMGAEKSGKKVLGRRITLVASRFCRGWCDKLGMTVIPKKARA